MINSLEQSNLVLLILLLLRQIIQYQYVGTIQSGLIDFFIVEEIDTKWIITQCNGSGLT